ncbi:DNA internalization-related competence protein ComEC/Rec2 [Planococcus maritimus]|uniref:DNA internalization-related competence protein ComEC/Rec2 n=2 Tax=Planococcus maritimus TaxID=192421 RepID=UPI00084CA8B0|nr:DNA internalization-related competence protein ComEC/Rec2 [Planococcus maritimus]OED32227.1 DNA internalization-related competence protein ComEC/Rec2 [Planococcus maritimus]
MAIAVAIAAQAAHGSANQLLLMMLLFCWMIYKRARLSWLVIVLGISMISYLSMDARIVEGPLLAGDYQGVLTFDEISIDGDRLSGFAADTTGRVIYASYRIRSIEEQQSLLALGPSASLYVSGEFQEPRMPAHSYAFDMLRYLKRHNASGMLEVGSISTAQSSSGFRARLAKQRSKLIEHIDKTFPVSLAVEAQALLLGERSSMDAEQTRIQRTLGITHLFAISGLHIGIVTTMMYFILLRLRVRKENATVLLLLVLPLYAMLAGAAPSVMRACAMVMMVLGARLIGHHVSAVQALSASFLLFLWLDPGLLQEIGFQLSFGASFGIIASLKLMEGASVIKSGLIVTAVSQLCLYPLLLLHFYEISLSSFLVNVLYVPLFTLLILPANFILLAASFVPIGVDNLLFSFYEPLRSLIEQLTVFLAGLAHQVWTPGRPSAIWLLFMVVSVLVFFIQAEKGFRLRLLSILLIPAMLLTAKPYLDPRLHVSFIDVGQGDSALIELPFRKGVYLIDAGGVLRFDSQPYQEKSRPFEVGRQTVVPYLKGRGISNIDLFILSHPDADHAEGADEVFEELAVEHLHITPGSEANALMLELTPAATEARVELPKSGSYWQVGETQFTYLSPEDNRYEGNDDSLVLLMEHQGQGFVFTGDLEAEGEAGVVERYGDKLADAAVLKVGHHGSKTSSSRLFLEALRPEISVVSAGIDNRYGHPSPEVTERFEELGLALWSTAEHGTIHILVEAGRMSIDGSRK